MLPRLKLPYVSGKVKIPNKNYFCSVLKLCLGKFKKKNNSYLLLLYVQVSMYVVSSESGEISL